MQALETAEKKEKPPLDDLFNDVYHEKPPHLVSYTRISFTLFIVFFIIIFIESSHIPSFPTHTPLDMYIYIFFFLTFYFAACDIFKKYIIIHSYSHSYIIILILITISYNFLQFCVTFFLNVLQFTLVLITYAYPNI